MRGGFSFQVEGAWRRRQPSKKKNQLRELMIHVFVYKLFVRREKRVDLLEREPANKRKGIGVKSLQVFSESY